MVARRRASRGEKAGKQGRRFSISKGTRLERGIMYLGKDGDASMAVTQRV